MRKNKKGSATGLYAIAEYAQDLMSATADVAGEKVADARYRLSKALEHGKEVSGKAWDGAVSQAKAGDRFVRKNPYAALGIGLGIGVIIGFLLHTRDED